MQSVEKDGEKKKKKKEIIKEDSVLVGEKGIDLLKKRCGRQRLKRMSVDKKRFLCGSWLVWWSNWCDGGATGAMVQQKKRRRVGWSQFVIKCIVTRMIW